MDIRVTAVRASDFQNLFTWTLCGPVEPGESAHANGVLGFGPLDADGQTGRGPNRGVRESAGAELGECPSGYPGSCAAARPVRSAEQPIACRRTPG
jgi:hypothetical protein